MGKGPPISIFWFRRDLRLHDNHGLWEALSSENPVLPVFIFDKNILSGLTDRKDRRVAFIHQTIHQIQQQLMQVGASLQVLHETPLDAFKKLAATYDVRQVFTNHDYEPYALQRDAEIDSFLSQHSIAFHTFKDQVNFEKNEILKPDGQPYQIFTPYSKAWKQKYGSEKKQTFPSEKKLHHFVKINALPVPTFHEIGFETSVHMVPSPVIDENLISNYDQTRNFPALPGTTKLSVHLRFGTVSIRHLASVAIKCNDSWLNELIWREFFMMILFHFPHVVTSSFKPAYDHIPWRNDEMEFEKWCRGETGYPLVDAGMRELNATGWMHNRVRMVVATFLTKHLLIDWRWGEAYFAEKLLDYELSSNNGNWQWAAGSGCDAAPYFRIFSPEQQTKRFDPEHRYIEKWVGNLKNYTLTRIVDHATARQRALATFKKALDQTK